MMLLLEMVSASGFYIIGEMYGVLWPAVVTPHMAHLGRRPREQVEGAPDTPEKAVGEFNIGRRHEHVAGANGDNAKPAQGKVSEVVCSRPPNIIKGRFGSNPEGKFKPAQMPVITGANGCPTTLALKPAQPARGQVSKPALGSLALAVSEPAHEGVAEPAQPAPGQVSKPALGSLALAVSEPAHELVPEPAHRAMIQPDPSGDRDRNASDTAAERAVAAFVSMLDKGEGLRAHGGVLFTLYDLKRAACGWPKLTVTAFGRLLRKAVEAAGGKKIKSGGQVYVGIGVPAGWQSGGRV
jgi:hypothetical protein